MYYRLAAALFCGSLAYGQTPPPSVDWRISTNLPQVDMSGLTPAQKNTALQALRTQPCLCGCAMQLAECRTKDPTCTDSRALSEIVVRAVKAGRDPQQALSDSDLVKRKMGSGSLLEAPVRIPIESSPVRGPANARITLIEFSDFECPFCSKAAAKIESVQQAYPKDVKLIYKQYPLSSHPHAQMAAEAALAAQAQDKFWPMHDQLFANSRRLSPETIDSIAQELGLDMAKFRADMKSAKLAQVIKKDMADGEKAQVDSTPTFFINGKRFNGPLEMVVLKPVLDAELKPAK